MICLDGTPYRVLSHSRSTDPNGSNTIWLIDLSVDKFRIITMSIKELLDGIATGSVVACTDSDNYPTPILQAGDKAIVDHRYNMIRGYIDKLYPNYSVLAQRGVSKDALENLAKSCNLSTRQLRRCLLRFVQSGGTYLSLVDMRSTRSYRSDYDPYAGKVRGPKRAGKDNKVQMTAKLEELFEEAYARYVREVNKYKYDSHTKYRPTLKGAYNTMILEHFSSWNEDKQPELLPDDERPSYDRFYYWVRKKLLGDKVTNHSVSARDRRNNNRLLVGTSDYGIYNLMEMVEIDENECSLCLVSVNPGTPHQAIGHPVTYIAIDVLTHRIVGAAIGFANNAYEGFLDLMDSMLMDDDEIARFFDVPIDKNRPVFPGKMLPHEIRVDHGAEYTSEALTENLTGGNGSVIMEGVPIKINLVPVATGSLKGIVEHFFSVLHQNIQAALNSGLGYVTGTHNSKHNRDAVLNITDFRKIAYKVIRMHNNSPIVDYPVTPSIAEAVPVITPNALWNYFSDTRLSGIDVSDGKMRIAARFGLMKSDLTFMISKRQISYGGVLFWDVGDDKILQAECIKLGEESKPVSIRYDPRSVNTLYRFDSVTGHIFRYKLAEKRPAMQGYRDMRWAEAIPLIKQHGSDRYERKVQKSDEQILLQAEIRDLVEKAVEAHGEGMNNTTNRREYAQAERAALTAYDNSRKNQIFYGSPDGDTPELPALAVTPVALPEHDDLEDEVVPEIDISDIDDLACAFRVNE